MMPERQCANCTRQAEWGCDAFKYEVTKDTKGGWKERDGRYYAWHKPALYPLDIDGEQTYACPRRDLKREPLAWSRLLFYFDHYQKGFLPQSGAVVDQTNKSMELFRVLALANDDVDKANDEIKRRKQSMDQRVAALGGPPRTLPPPKR
jgi:hypothetical protein